MNSYADKTLQNKNQSAAGMPYQKQNNGKPTFQFIDNRPEAVAQRKLQEITKTNPVQQSPLLSTNSQTIQRKLKYNDKIYGSMKDLAVDGDAWEAYQKSKKENKRELLSNPDKVFDLQNNFSEVSTESFTGEQIEKLNKDDMFTEILSNKLDKIAEKNYGKNCHIVATEMQDAFKEAGITAKVIEIYAEDEKDGNHINVMEARVRNHYATIYKGKAYDSRTGSKGENLEYYLNRLQEENPDRELKHKTA